jgi:hypothetical protein
MLRRLLARALGPLRALDTRERLVLFGVAVLHGTAITWGLPASDGWDVDGIAPRDFLPGVIETFTPGHYFTYPPFHLLLLALLTLPVSLVTLARAPSLASSDVIAAFLTVPVMTTFALTARIVSFLMSLGVVMLVGQLAKSIFDAPNARAWAMAVAGVEVAGTYYAHTTNLDMPALFWALCALVALVQALGADEPRRLRRVAVLAAFAVASKDQAYAVLVLTLPAAIAGWFVVRPRGERAGVIREAVIAAAIAVGLVLLLDGALFNPTGFAARVRFLTGPASQDFAQHSPDWPGRLSALADTATFLPNHHPIAMAPIFVLGVGVAVARSRGRGRVIALVPLLGILSFTLAFNCVARRVEERFVMPQMQLLAAYAGVIAVVVGRARAVRRALGIAAATAGGACVALGARLSACVIFTMLGDARYDAEAFLREHVQPGDVIEVYGSNVYLPRMPRGATVERVGPTKSRNPMPGIVERQDRLGAIAERRPRWVVVGMGYAWRYLQDPRDPEGAGRVMPAVQRRSLADEDATSHFRALFAEEAGYAKVYVAHYAGTRLFPPRPLHASLATDVYVFERR